MSSNHRLHLHLARHSPPNVRKIPVKAVRSAPPSKTPLTPNITIKLPKGAKDHEQGCSQDDEDDDMASSFLQFW